MTRPSPADLLGDVIVAPRTDPIYNAHGYLTKVPVAAIVPYIEAFTDPGGVVLDMFAGSGMTGIAARMCGRHALLSDISVLGQHIGLGYLTKVDHAVFRARARQVMSDARAALGDLYLTNRNEDGRPVEMVRTVWSFLYQCVHCERTINYYHAIGSNAWKSITRCPHCDGSFSKRDSRYIGDEPVSVVVVNESGRQQEQPVQDIDKQRISEASGLDVLTRVPSLPIDSYREMYKRSALKKWRLENTRDFFSARNAVALFHLHSAILSVEDADIQRKLLFAFTAILPRASRRYQWSLKHPLNAANQTYYISPVYYEWNIFDLFGRKIEAALRSDQEIRRAQAAHTRTRTEQTYRITSATSLNHVADSSVDYVFTDPPFGSNLFYSDMSLFQEAWIGQQTDESQEAVIHTSPEKKKASNGRYEELLAGACQEAYRVLKPGSCMSLVFGNSSGKIWSMVQRILRSSGFERNPVHVGILDKGQRSVKGLASGFEGVATLDLILTVRKPKSGTESSEREPNPHFDIPSTIIDEIAALKRSEITSPSHIYLAVLKRCFEAGFDVETLHLSEILSRLAEAGYSVDPKTGLVNT